jgi:hypothetical protein
MGHTVDHKNREVGFGLLLVLELMMRGTMGFGLLLPSALAIGAWSSNGAGSKDAGSKTILAWGVHTAFILPRRTFAS